MPAVTISAKTTLPQLHEEYRRCCGYDVDADGVTLARQFLRVCRALLSPQFGQEIEHGGRGGSSRMVISVETLQQQLKEVTGWLTANDPTFSGANSGGGLTYLSASDGSWRD